MARLQTQLHSLPGFPVLPGARVRLRAPTADDAPALFAVFSDAEVMRYWRGPRMHGVGEAEGKVAEMLEAFAERAMLHWVIADRRDDVAIGTCALFGFDRGNDACELGYALHRDHWRRGLAHEAASLAIAWARGTLGLRHIEAEIHPRNQASRALLGRLGFRDNAPHPGDGEDGGEWPRLGLALQADD